MFFRADKISGISEFSRNLNFRGKKLEIFRKKNTEYEYFEFFLLNGNSGIPEIFYKPKFFQLRTPLFQFFKIFSFILEYSVCSILSIGELNVSNWTNHWKRNSSWKNKCTPPPIKKSNQIEKQKRKRIRTNINALVDFF